MCFLDDFVVKYNINVVYVFIGKVNCVCNIFFGIGFLECDWDLWIGDDNWFFGML